MTRSGEFSGSGWGAFERVDDIAVLTAPPAVVARKRGQYDLFVRGIDNAIWTRWSSIDYDDRFASWGHSGWGRIGGECSSGPAVCATGEDSLALFVRGMDNALWFSWYKESAAHWSPFESLGGQITSAPAAVSKNPGQMDVFARNLDGGVSTRSYSQRFGWSDWGDLGGSLSSSPAAGEAMVDAGTNAAEPRRAGGMPDEADLNR